MQHDDMDLNLDLDDEDGPEEETPEQGGIPVFKWRNSRGEEGWASFRDPDDLTGRDVQSLRNMINDAGPGAITNAFMAKALQLLVEAWEVPMPDGKPTPVIPRHDKSGKVLGTLPGKFLVALERHVEPHLEFMKPNKKQDEDDEEPGSPRRPVRG